MEDQKIITTSTPRITLKRTSVNKKIGWEIASSSSKDETELKLIVEMMTRINGEMEIAFTKIKKEVGK